MDDGDGNQVQNQLAEFEAAMADTEALENCNCPPDCEQTAYKVQVCKRGLEVDLDLKG